MQSKPKFKLSKLEMLSLNDACNDAANGCPQYRNHWLIEDRDILLGDISAKGLVKHWLKCDTLWKSGYADDLDTDIIQVFKVYKLYKSKMKCYKYEMDKQGELIGKFR